MSSFLSYLASKALLKMHSVSFTSMRAVGKAPASNTRVLASHYLPEEVASWVGKGRPLPDIDPAAIFCFISIPGMGVSSFLGAILTHGSLICLCVFRQRPAPYHKSTLLPSAASSASQVWMSGVLKESFCSEASLFMGEYAG